MSANPIKEPPLVDQHKEETFRVSVVSHSFLISTTEKTLIDDTVMDGSGVCSGNEEENVEIVQKEATLDINDGNLVNSSSCVDKNGIFKGEIGGLGVLPNGGVRDGEVAANLGEGGVGGSQNANAEVGVETKSGVGVGGEILGQGGVDGGGIYLEAKAGTESVVATEKGTEDQNEGVQEYEEMKVDTEAGDEVLGQGDVEGLQSVKVSLDGGEEDIKSVAANEKYPEDQIESTGEYEEMKVDTNQNTGSPSHKESNVGSIVVDLDASFGKVGQEDVVKEGYGGDDKAGGSARKQKRKTSKQKTGLEQHKGSEFATFDLVWGKVKSHPWWPGQIFDPSYASETAMKYYKKDKFFVAYFGDQTFAWNGPLSLKPFKPHFSEMEKQAIAPAFTYAVNSALDEVSRRVELGLSCSCTPEDIYAAMKTQMIINSGIEGEVCDTVSVDRYFSVTSFEPDKLAKYIKALALGESIGSDRLGFVISQAQLAAFYRWKGHSHLPNFHVFLGVSGDVEHATPVSESVWDVDIGSTKLKSQQKTAPKKRDNLEEKSSKKERSLTELMDQKLSSGKKRKDIISSPIDEGFESKKQRLTPSTSSATKSPSSRGAYKVGDRIRRIARQLSGSPPILKYSDGGFQKNAFKVDGRSNKLHEVDVITHIPRGTLDRPTATRKGYSSPDEMLSQLFLAAKDPTKGYSFLTTIVAFFTDFRNSISLDNALPVKQSKSAKKMSSTERGGKRRKRSSKITSTESDGHGDVSDSYWTDRIIQSSPEEKSSGRRKKRKLEFPLEISLNDSLTLEPETSHDLNPICDSTKEDTSTGEPVNSFQVITTDFKEECPDDTTGLDANVLFDDKKDSGELTPTELILEFTNAKTVPSESDLNNIFSPFGSVEEETKILKKTRRAVVVFQRHDDADAAYNNACKYSVFGPGLVSYELRPSRGPLRTTTQGGADGSPLKDNTN